MIVKVESAESYLTEDLGHLDKTLSELRWAVTEELYPGHSSLVALFAVRSAAETLAAILGRQVTRFEVIDEGGRSYQRQDVVVTTGIQDSGSTMKVFVSGRNKHERNS